MTFSSRKYPKILSQVLGLCSGLSLLACQGELKLNDGVAMPPNDLAQPKDELPATLGFADIYKDMDTPPGLGCTNQVPSCHGGATPTGQMALLDMAAGDMTKLMTTYTNVSARVNTSDPAGSLLLLKMLNSAAGGTSHAGGPYFQDQNNSMYKRWLAWIKLGAKFESVSTASLGGGQ